MSKTPPIPEANQTTKGPGHDGHGESASDQTAHVEDHKHHNANEQGQTANIKQNTTNAGFFKGRRVK